MSETCVFCGYPRLSDDPPEHVFPKWVSLTVKALGGSDLFQVTTDNPKVPAFSCELIEITTESVCAKCNHGWMSDLESRVAPLLRNAIKGGSAPLPADKHRRLATWTCKTAMMIDCWWGERTGERHVPDAHCSDLFRHKIPRNATYVWTTSYGFDPKTEHFRDSWAQRSRIELASRSTGKRTDGYVVTFQFGYLVMQALTICSDEEGLGAFRRSDLAIPNGDVVPAARISRQLWPSGGAEVGWPPPIALDSAGLTLFASQPPFVAAP